VAASRSAGSPSTCRNRMDASVVPAMSFSRRPRQRRGVTSAKANAAHPEGRLPRGVVRNRSSGGEVSRISRSPFLPLSMNRATGKLVEESHLVPVPRPITSPSPFQLSVPSRRKNRTRAANTRFPPPARRQNRGNAARNEVRRRPPANGTTVDVGRAVSTSVVRRRARAWTGSREEQVPSGLRRSSRPAASPLAQPHAEDARS